MKESLYDVPNLALADVMLQPWDFHSNPAEVFARLTFAYYDSCKAVFEDVSSRARTGKGLYKDCGIFPALFLYRHTIELCLKSMILYSFFLKGARQGVPVSLRNKLTTEHSLKELWARFEKDKPFQLETLSSRAFCVLTQLIEADSQHGIIYKYALCRNFYPLVDKEIKTNATFLWEKLQLLGDEMTGKLEGLWNWHDENRANAEQGD